MANAERRGEIKPSKCSLTDFEMEILPEGFSVRLESSQFPNGYSIFLSCLSLG